VRSLSPLLAWAAASMAADLARIERISEAGWMDEHPAIALDREGRGWVAWIAAQGDANAVAVSDGGQVRRVTEQGNHHSAAIAVDGRGWVHVVWSQRDGEAFHLYESVYLAERWTRATRLTADGTSNISPVLSADANGRLALVWQSQRDSRSVVMLRIWEGRGWRPEQPVSPPGGNAWSPAIAWDRGTVWVVWDAYQTGNYRVYARAFPSGVPGTVEQLSESERFAVRPCVAVTASGYPVVAWEESDSIWGKDFPFGSDRDAATMAGSRRIRVAYRPSAGWRDLPSPDQRLAPQLRRSARAPKLAVDSKGRVLLLFRVLAEAVAGRSDFRAAVERWEAYLTQLEGDDWRQATAIPFSAGRYSMGAAMASDGGRFHIAWTSDRQAASSDGGPGEKDVLAAVLNAAGNPATLP
jgi:hypothetical protein